MSLHYLPEIADGVLLSRLGDVHRDTGRLTTSCGQSIRPARFATVSHVQAVVHKLRLCPVCYPAHHVHGPGGGHVKH